MYGNWEKKIQTIPVAIIMPKKGLTIVICPLLSLIVDQIFDLNTINVPAAKICSRCGDLQKARQELLENNSNCHI